MKLSEATLGKIQEAFRTQDYQEAIRLSEGIPEAFFILAYQRVMRKKVKPAFWQAVFKLKSDSILAHESMLPLSVQFWKHNWTMELAKQFVNTSQKLFIRSIRISGLFLEWGFLEMLEGIMDKSEYVQVHFAEMKSLREKQEELIQKTESLSRHVWNLPVNVFLSELVIWWEEQRSESIGIQNTMFNLQHEALKIYFSGYRGEIIDHEATYKTFLDTSVKYNETGELAIDVLMRALQERSQFETNVLEEYQYEIRHDFDNSWEFRLDNRARNKFRSDGKKLRIFQRYWHYRAMFNVSIMEEQKLIKIKDNDVFDLNSYVSREHISLLLDYIGYFEALDDVDSFVPALFSSLQVHAQSRYRSKMDEQVKKGLTPVQALVMVSAINRGHGFPIQVNTVESFELKVDKTYKGRMEKELIRELVPRALTTPDKCDILERPLLLLEGNQTINLLNLTSESNFFFRSYFNMVEAMDQQRDQDADSLFEEMISKAFGKDFESEHSIDYELNKGSQTKGVKGDLDVIVTEGNEALLLEVKRIKLRHDSSGIWNEYEKVSWAGLQLQKTKTALAEGCVKLERCVVFKEGRILGLIITPWFEYDHEVINGHLKISWFEIMYVLTQMKAEWKDKKNRLRALTDLLIHDRAWPHVFKAADQYEELMKQSFGL